MHHRLRNRLKFEIERFILYRSLHQLLLIAVVIGIIAVMGGVAVWLLTDDFRSLPDAVWWSFLRLTDPGYIGDDTGGTKRTISTIVSVLGYIFFLGALVAVMTQGLHQMINRLQRGLTPIAQNNHILILGWTSRTPIILKQLLLSEGRVRSFLRRRGLSSLRVVIQAEEVTPKLTHELRAFLGDLWNGRQITLRSGTPLLIEHLERVDFLNAAVIILPGGEFGEDKLEYPDGRTVKTLMSMKNSARTHKIAPEKMPLMVAELADHRKREIARAAYGGPIETLESDMFIARLMAQIIRNPGLSHIYYELLTHEEGDEIYLRDYPELTGRIVGELLPLFPDAVIAGLYRNDRRRFYSFTAAARERIRSDDRLVLIAPGAKSHNLLDIQSARSGAGAPATLPDCTPPVTHQGCRRILLLGWNSSVPSLLGTLESYTDERYEITSLALLSPEERRTRLSRRGVDPTRLDLRFVEGEFTLAPEVAALRPWEFDNIVICASEWLETGGESDARTVLGYLVLQNILGEHPEGKRPKILAQLMNETNAPLFPEDSCETLTSPVVLSHLLAQVALQRDLRGVFDELFGPGGAEIYFRSAAHYDLAGTAVSFTQIREAALSKGEIAIGLRIAANIGTNGGIKVNPPREQQWELTATDDIVLLQDRH